MSIHEKYHFFVMNLETPDNELSFPEFVALNGSKEDMKYITNEHVRDKTKDFIFMASMYGYKPYVLNHLHKIKIKEYISDRTLKENRETAKKMSISMGCLEETLYKKLQNLFTCNI